MPDIYSKKKRSDIMSHISGKETKPEILVRKFLFANGFRFRKNVKDLPGKPDIVLSKYKIVIFVNGCFWHGHDCKRGTLPESNHEFWAKKIGGNVERDRIVLAKLQQQGWKVIIVWQCEIRNEKLCAERLQFLITEIETDPLLGIENRLVAEPQVLYLKPPKQISYSDNKERKTYILKVTYPNGRVVADRSAYKTLIDIVQIAGAYKVQSLGIVVNKIDLISKTVESCSKIIQKFVGNGLYVITSTDMDTKRRIIEQISEALNMGLKVEKILIV
jgi:DNA mismatch endonuclease (patch repair protein)